MLLMGGALRPVVHIALASMIMYHDQRMEAGEMRPACIKLIEVLKRIGISATKLSEWGAIIRIKCDADNAHLAMGRTGNGDTSQVVRALGRSLSEMKSEVAALRRDIAAEHRRSASAPPTPVQAAPTSLTAATPVTAPDPVVAPPSMGPLIPPVSGASEVKPTSLELKDTLAGYYYANNDCSRGQRASWLVGQ